LTGKEGVGKLTILNLFPGENILEIDLNLNEIFKKRVEISIPDGIEEYILRVIDLNELVRNLGSYKDLLQSIDIICIITNSQPRNLKSTRMLLSKLKQKVPGVNYYVIANFQDRKRIVLEVEKVEKMLEEKTFGFSAVQKDSTDKLFSIIKNMLKVTKLEKEIKTIPKIEIIYKEEMKEKYTNIWSEIEEARMLDNQGKKLIAAKKFSSVAVHLKELGSEIKSNQEGEQINGLHYLCKAWEFMTLAEEFEDPKNYLEAANLFTKASEHIHNSKLKLLALGNSEFCRALKLGLELYKLSQIKNNVEYYPKIKILINKAVDLYKKGGFEKEAEWALNKSSHFGATNHSSP